MWAATDMGGGLPGALLLTGIVGLVVVAIMWWLGHEDRRERDELREKKAELVEERNELRAKSAALDRKLANAEAYIAGIERGQQIAATKQQPAIPPPAPPQRPRSHRAPEPARAESARTTGEIPVTRTEVLPVVKA